MKLNAKSLTTAGVVWFGSLTAAWYLGMQQRPSAGKDDGNSLAASESGESSGVTGTGSAAGGRKARVATDGSTHAGKPLTVKQIIAKTRAAMRGGAMTNPRSMKKAMAMLEAIRIEDIAEALAEVESVTDLQLKLIMQEALLGKWGEADGPAAMKYVEEHAGTGMMAQMGKMGVASAWAEKDPEAVWKWYQGQADEGGGGTIAVGHTVLASLFSKMAANDPALAFKRLEELKGSWRETALGGMYQSTMFHDDKRVEILKEVEAMPVEAERKHAKKMMLEHWTMMAPDQAAEWVKTQPAAEQSTLRESMGTMLIVSDPKKGAAFLLDGTTDEQKPQRYALAVTTWAMSDASAAGTWLSAQPQGPHLDAARQSFVIAASPKDPESAMAWAGTITDADKRAAATGMAYRAWRKKDPAAAETALTGSGLSEEQIQTVQQSPAGPAESLLR